VVNTLASRAEPRLSPKASSLKPPVMVSRPAYIAKENLDT